MLQWLNNFWSGLGLFIKDTFYWAVNLMIEAVATLLAWLASIFPSYEIPAPDIVGNWGGQFYATLSWLFPVQYSISLVAVFVAVYTLLFSGGFILRFLGVIR